jgi:Bacterial extracellular solute-binding proteins, family 3
LPFVNRTVAYLLFFPLICCAVGGEASAQTSSAEPLKIVCPHIPNKEIESSSYYFYRLLLLSLQKSEAKFGRYSLIENSDLYSDDRLKSVLIQHDVDVIWSPTSQANEERMLPIKISLLKDLNNYRILLIRKNEQHKFDGIKTANALRKLRGGMNPQWLDATVMEANKFPTVYSTGYNNLFKMLAAGRFDYFSRGLYQAQSEAKRFADLDLVIEQNLLLQYTNNVYFFVRKDDAALANRIEVGLKIAMADGSFDELFNSIPQFLWGMETLKKSNRVRIDLQTPASSVP